MFTLTSFLVLLYQLPQFESKDLYGKWTIIKTEQKYYSLCLAYDTSAIIGTTFSFQTNDTLIINYHDQIGALKAEKVVWQINGNDIISQTKTNEFIEFTNVRINQDSLFFNIAGHFLTFIKQ